MASSRVCWMALASGLLVASCGGGDASAPTTTEMMTTTTAAKPTTTTVDPNLDPYYPEYGNPWGISESAVDLVGVDVAVACLIINTMPPEPDLVTVREIAQRLGASIRGGSEDLGALNPYWEDLATIAEMWRENYPQRRETAPFSVRANETARQSGLAGQFTPACRDTTMQSWLDSKGLNEAARTALGL